MIFQHMILAYDNVWETSFDDPARNNVRCSGMNAAEMDRSETCNGETGAHNLIRAGVVLTDK